MSQAEKTLNKSKQILDKKYVLSLSTVQIGKKKLSESDVKELEYK